MKARAASPGTDLDAGQCRVVVRINLLEYVDGAGAGRINPLSSRIEPEVVDAEDASKRRNDLARLRIHHGQSSGLERCREQAMAGFVQCQCVSVTVARNFPLLHRPVFGLVTPEGFRTGRLPKNLRPWPPQLKRSGWASAFKFFERSACSRIDDRQCPV